MVAGGDQHAGHGAAPEGERFALERFEWVAPDRLDVAGTFLELREPPSSEPALVVRAESGWRHLPALPETVGGPPRAGDGWRATFGWQETPIAFEDAELIFGDELSVQLPKPTAHDEAAPTLVLTVLRAAPGDDRDDGAVVPEDEAEIDALGGRVELIRLETELLAAQEQGREQQAAVEQAADEVVRLHAELEAERERHAQEAERFHDGLARVREMAEQAVADAQAEAEARTAELREAQAEILALRERVEATEALSAQLDDARAGAQQTLDRLAQLAETIEDHDPS